MAYKSTKAQKSSHGAIPENTVEVTRPWLCRQRPCTLCVNAMQTQGPRVCRTCAGRAPMSLTLDGAPRGEGQSPLMHVHPHWGTLVC